MGETAIEKVSSITEKTLDDKRATLKEESQLATEVTSDLVDTFVEELVSFTSQDQTTKQKIDEIEEVVVKSEKSLDLNATPKPKETLDEKVSPKIEQVVDEKI